MRSGYLDSLRGIAVIWMVIFHACYDLNMFHVINWDFSDGFWYAFPRVIAFTFLFCVGLSLNFTHAERINWNHLRKRGVRLGTAAIVISIATYVMFPGYWIYFGTLHCILVGSLLGAVFVNHRRWAWALLGLILLCQYGLGYDIKWVSSIVKKPSLDFIPIYPWFWAILLGIVLGPYLSKIRQLNDFEAPVFLRLLGTHSLKIYLLHQPLIYGLIWLLF